jgi:hypothetical protein
MANQRLNPLLNCQSIHNIFHAKKKKKKNHQMGSNTKKFQKPPLEVEEAS